MKNVAQGPTDPGRQNISAQAGPGSHPFMHIPAAVAKLSDGARLIAQIMADRPALVAAALLDGATVAQIAAVLGWEFAELRMAVRRWAPQLRKAGQLTEDQCAALLAVAFEPANQ